MATQDVKKKQTPGGYKFFFRGQALEPLKQKKSKTRMFQDGEEDEQDIEAGSKEFET